MERLQTPLSIRSTILIKTVGFFCLILSAFAVLYTGLSTPIYSHDNTYRIDILMAASVALIHLAYLRIVFKEKIIDKGVENLTIGAAIFPFLLVIVYVLYGLHSLAYNKGLLHYADNLKLISYIAFIMLYVLWCLRDYIIAKSNWSSAAREFIWIIVDLISITILSCYLFFGFKGFHLLNYSVTPKDLAVVCCISVWMLLRGHAILQRRSIYSKEYLAYLEHNPTEVQIHGERVPDLGITNLRDVTIVDLGCGNGLRLVQLIKWMIRAGHLKEGACITAVGYDRDESWSDKFESTCRDSGLTGLTTKFITENRKLLLQEQLGNADVLLLSHILYELKTWRLVSELLQHCRTGTLIVARGISVRSFFTVVNIAYSRRYPRPTISHLWRTHGLQSLIASRPLEEVASCLIEQPFSLDNGGANDAKSLLNYLYGEGAAQLAGEYFSMLVEEKRTIVPNDDVFVFLKVLGS